MVRGNVQFDPTVGLTLSDSTVRGNIGRINVHGYQHSGRRDQLGDLTAAAGRKVWNPEDGESARGSAARHRVFVLVRTEHRGRRPNPEVYL